MLQSSLPCSENFFRYKKNYEKFVGPSGDGIQGGSPRSIAESDQVSSISGDTTKSDPIRTIASPKILTKSSPVNELARRNNLQLRVDTAGARNALQKYAINPPSLASAAGG